MSIPERLITLLAVGALATGAAACSTDDAVERDTRDAREKIDKEAGDADEKAGEAAGDAKKEAEKAAEDVDGN
jgi:hypothetical protein